MRSILLCLALAGCTVAAPPPAQPRRDCPILPTLKPGDDARQHIRIIADIYARCAATP
nr:hypothetical protein [uncultured Cupriavidus sp.]